MKTVSIPFVTSREALFTRAVPAIPLCMQWQSNDYTCQAQARLCYGEEALYVGFTVWEDWIHISKFEQNDRVYLDSCCEFFLSPDADLTHYVNFEMNAVGTLLAKYNHQGEKFQYLPRTSQDEALEIRRTVTRENYLSFQGPLWQISYQLPFTLLQPRFPAAVFGKGLHMRGNFYKCMQSPENRHFMTWNPIETETPSYHSPQFFGEIILD